MWANETGTAMYTPDPDYAYNAGGGPITIERSATGAYLVAFDGLEAVGTNSGNVQVTAYGSAGEYCKVATWGPANVSVRCFDAAGDPADTRFTLLFLKPAADTGGLAYAWGNDSGAESYTPNGFYSHNAGGGAVEIERRETGYYSVTFEGLETVGDDGGHVQVTAYGTGSESCKVGGWDPALVDVVCFDAAGAPVDTDFSLLFLKPEAGTPGVAYAWANDEDTETYAPHASYAYNAGGGPIEAGRLGTGSYTLSFGDFDTGTNGGHVQVTAYGFGGERCNVAEWGPGVAWVLCFDAAGAPVDTRYTALFLAPEPAVGCGAAALGALALLARRRRRR